MLAYQAPLPRTFLSECSMEASRRCYTRVQHLSIIVFLPPPPLQTESNGRDDGVGGAGIAGAAGLAGLLGVLSRSVC